MPAAYQDIAVDFVDRPRAQVTKDRAYTLQCVMAVDGTQSVPTSATIDVKGPGGSALPTPVAGAAVTIAGDGAMSYVLSSGNANSTGANYTALWHPVVSSVTYDFIQLFDVVLYPLRNVVRQADLVLHHNDLTDSLFSGEATAQSYIEQAFQDLFQFIDSKGKRYALILSVEDTRRPIEHRALQLYFQSRRKVEGDRWDLLMAYHRDQYAEWCQSANFVYDITQSGTADGTQLIDTESGEEGERLGAVRWRV